MLPKRRITFFVGILAAAVAAAQSTNFELGRVDFWRPADFVDHWIVVIEDGMSGLPLSGADRTAGWSKLGNFVVKKPVAYASGCRARVGAVFIKEGCSNPVNPVGPPMSYYARGTVIGQDNQPLGIALPIKRLQKSGSGDKYEYPATSVSTAFESNKIRYFEHFRIRWECSMSDDPNGTWTVCGVSENPLYVTQSKPKDENPGAGYRHFYTLLHIGCKYADGAHYTALADGWKIITNHWSDTRNETI